MKFSIQVSYDGVIVRWYYCFQTLKRVEKLKLDNNQKGTETITLNECLQLAMR